MGDSQTLEAADESGLREQPFDNAPDRDLERRALPERSGSTVTPEASNLVRALELRLLQLQMNVINISA